MGQNDCHKNCEICVGDWSFIKTMSLGPKLDVAKKYKKEYEGKLFSQIDMQTSHEM